MHLIRRVPHLLRRAAPLLVALALVASLFPASGARAAGTTYYVSTLVDDDGTHANVCALSFNNSCTLRDALVAATSGQDTILFITAANFGVYTLGTGTGQGTLTIAHSVTITGPGANNVAIDGGLNAGAGTAGVRVFLVNSGVKATISGLTIQHGNTPNSGGGILNNGTLALTNDIIANNHATNSGGGLFTNGFLTMGGCAVITNSSGDGGAGGLYANGGIVSTLNTTFSGNHTTGGGDSIVTVTSTYLIDSTIVGTTTTVNTGIVVIDGGLTFFNSIITGPAGSTNCSANSPTLLKDNGYNVQFPDASCGATIPVADPLLDPAGLQPNGGPVPTYALLPGSPAIDNEPATAAGCSGADARGVARPQGPACDSGAFESRGFTLTATSGGGHPPPLVTSSRSPSWQRLAARSASR